MKRIYKIIIAVAMIGFVSSCTSDFKDVNKDPGVVTDPDLSHLLTYSLYQLGSYQYTEWFYDNYQYIWRYSEATIFQGANSSDFNTVGALGGRVGSWYGSIMQNLFEIRRRIDAMDDVDKAKYQKMWAITFVPQIIQGIKVTDWYGSEPYTEAMQGRYQSNFTPKYDTQQELFDTWLSELDNVIEILTSNSGFQVSPGNQDFIYQGDYDRWAKLANSLKLRIAVRLLNQDQTKAVDVINEVISSPAGMITDDEDQMVWAPATDYRGEAHDFWGAPSGSKNFIDFLRGNHDPRVRVMFEKNAFDQASVDLLKSQGKQLPKFVQDPVDETWDQYQGGPVSPDSSGVFDYFGLVKDNANQGYVQLSHINRRFFDPQYDGGTGYWVDVKFSAAEVDFYMAEFIEKGLISGQGTAKEWYDKGVASSLKYFDMIAKTAQITNYDQLKLDDNEIGDLLAMPDYALDGNDDLEKIYIQQYINFFRLPNEMGALVRRTGYPKKGSSLLAWEPVRVQGSEIPLPRRFPVTQPTININLENWQAAIAEEGFTAGANDGPVLNSERIWWDKNDPNYGEGN